MQLVNLTVYKKNGNLTSQSIAVDVDDFIGPVRFNSGSKSYFSLIAKRTTFDSLRITQDQYEVNETLSAIQALSAKLLILTVTQRRLVTVTTETMVFNAGKVIGDYLTTGLGTEFLYLEYGNPEPVRYVVSESIATIMSQQTVGGLANITGLITAGSNVGLSGAGTSGSPYSISSNATGLVTAGTNVTITGSGTTGSPYVVNSSGGGGGGVAIPADQLVYGTGASVGSTSKFYRTSTVGTGEGQVIIGNSLTIAIGNYRLDAESMCVVARTTDPALSTNAHAFVDATIFNRTSNGNAYNSFTANVQYDNTSLYDHYVPFQSSFQTNAACGISKIYFGADIVSLAAGSNIVTRYGPYMFDATGSGTIGTQIAFYCPTLAKASTNWAIKIESNESQFLDGANIRMTTVGSATNNTTPFLDFYFGTTVLCSRHGSTLKANSTTQDFYVSGSTLLANRLAIQIDGDAYGAGTGTGRTTIYLNGNIGTDATGCSIGRAADKFSFWGAAPVVQQTGGAATAGAVYTATEQAMLNALYSMARTTGLLS